MKGEPLRGVDLIEFNSPKQHQDPDGAGFCAVYIGLVDTPAAGSISGQRGDI